MKPKESAALIKSLTDRGWILINGRYEPPNSPAVKELLLRQGSNTSERKKRLKTAHLKTGWIDDTRNIRNKEKQVDVFIRLVKQELDLEVWPEFYFDTERQYRIDYAIPVLQDGTPVKIAVEVDGGIWLKGNSGHSSGTGIKRDMEKGNLLNLKGWRLIRVTPEELVSSETTKLLLQLVLEMYDTK